jgi:hypothetical protein
VFTTGETTFKHGSCRDVKNKERVNVRGRRLSDGTVEAREVELDD